MPSYHLTLVSLVLLHRDILCHRYPRRIASASPCYSYVTHCLESMLCHFAILRMSRLSLYVAFVAPPITSVWFPVSLRLRPRDSSPPSSPQDALVIPFFFLSPQISLSALLLFICRRRIPSAKRKNINRAVKIKSIYNKWKIIRKILQFYVKRPYAYNNLLSSWRNQVSPF